MVSPIQPNIRTELESLVPDVISAIPNQLLGVTFADQIEIHPGVRIRPRQARDAPCSVTWMQTNPDDKLYCLMMIDPDAPSPDNPVRRDCLHWMMVDVPASDMQSGRTLAEYISPGPPQGSDPHRYVLLACEQDRTKPMTDIMQIIRKNQVMPRVCFKTQQFLSDHNLRPVAVNLFRAEWDESVPELYAQFTDRPRS